MSSEHRSSSAVRNLRSLFENKQSDSPDPDHRGRSPSALSAATGETEGGGLRRTSRVRASFVSVEPTSNMVTVQPSESNVGQGEGVGEAVGRIDLKKAVSEEPTGSEEAVGGLPGTSNVEPAARQLAQPAEDKEPENPDKPMTAAEEEPISMKPADPASAEAVSGGQALPPVAEDLRKSKSHKANAEKETEKKPAANGTTKPAAISTKAASRAGPAIKSPASVKSPSSATSASKPSISEPSTSQPAKAPLKKPSRSSLTAPTAASMARSGHADKPASAATSKAKPRETTKPVSLPSHLIAPTASSRAKHEPEAQSKPATSNARASTTTKPKTSTTAAASKPGRASLAPDHRPGSRTSQTSHPRRSVAPTDGSFLERMMKPTTASASKTQEKTEMKSPPRQKAAAPSKPKVNGAATKKDAPKSKVDGKGTNEGSSTAAPMPSEVPVEEPKEDPPAATATDSEPASEPQAAAEEIKDIIPEPSTETLATEPELTVADNAVPFAEDSKSTEPLATGNETPQAAGETASGLEATPAGLGSEDTIR